MMSAPQLGKDDPLSGAQFGKIVDELQGLVDTFESLDPLLMVDHQSLGAQITEALSHIRVAEKQIHSGITKKTKELGSIDTQPIIKSPSGTSNRLIETAIFRHLLHLGLFDAARVLINESPLLGDQKHELAQQLAQCEALEGILKEIDNGNVSPALEWASSHPQFLIKAHSTLMNDLYSFQLACFAQKSRLDALAFLRAVGPGVFADNGRGIPLKLFSGEMPQGLGSRARESFEWAYLSQIGTSPVSQLEIATQAGLTALPQLARSYAVMRARNAEWTSYDELPVGINLPDELKFHPVFVCPVSKEQTSLGNPAQLLPCGHVLSRSTVRILCNEGLSKRVIKCPYCPESATVEMLDTIIFASE